MKSETLILGKINLQPPEKRVNSQNGELEVHSIFSTIQGEGPYAGHPAIFVRLAGCNLQCPGCDTDYTSQRLIMTPTELIKDVKIAAKGTKTNLIVLTGGEPLRQNCGEFITYAVTHGFDVQIETNGTLFDLSLSAMPEFANEALTIVCSPKAGINMTLRPYITFLKYVLHADSVGEDGLPDSVLGSGVAPGRPWPSFEGEVYLQPFDEGGGYPEQNARHLKACIDSCMKFGFILSVQTHKLVGLP